MCPIYYVSFGTGLYRFTDLRCCMDGLRSWLNQFVPADKVRECSIHPDIVFLHGLHGPGKWKSYKYYGRYCTVYELQLWKCMRKEGKWPVPSLVEAGFRVAYMRHSWRTEIWSTWLRKEAGRGMDWTRIQIVLRLSRARTEIRLRPDLFNLLVVATSSILSKALTDNIVYSKKTLTAKQEFHIESQANTLCASDTVVAKFVICVLDHELHG